jgi:hypothetical protein
MNRLIILTTLFAVLYKTAWAQTVSVEIREVTGALDTCTDTLLSSITTNPADATNNNDLTGLATTSSGSGAGAILTVVISGTTVTGVTVTTAGKGYKAGDTLKVANSLIAGTSTDLVITLSADDISNGGLKCGSDELKLSITGNPTDATDGTLTGLATTSSAGGGAGAILTIVISSSTVSGVTVTTAGKGYKAGDTLTVANSLIAGTSTDLTFKLLAADIDGYVKVTPSAGFYRNSVGGAFNGDGDFDKAILKGYYVALGKATNFISVKINYGTETMVPSVNGVSDTVLGDEALSALLPVEDGLNVLTLASSKDGTFVMNLIKPDDEIKVIQRSKRSMEIAYNPAAVGEFTCSAFTDASGLPTTRGNVKTGSGVIAKSVRTHNILPENIFNSIQVTLNGLTPSTTYDIHCFHLSHGIISNTDALGTDLASLTGVSLLPNTLVAGAYATLTLTFTHEKALAANAEILLTLYSDYNQQTITGGTGTTCGDKVTTHTSNGAEIIGAHTCAITSNVLKVVLITNGSPVASTSTGSEVILVLTDGANSDLNLENNAAVGTVVTYDLEVTGHGKLLQRDGWTTTAS